MEHIQAILFDMGGTLRGGVKRDPVEHPELIKKIIGLLGSDMDVKQFTRLLLERDKAYSQWVEHSMIDLNEQDRWTQWLLPDFPLEKISPIADQLNRLWREATGLRELFPDAMETLIGLFRKGYRLGVVSNTVSSSEAHELLAEMRLAGCIETVILSCVVGVRKPNPAILKEATIRMGIDPSRCAYIGNKIYRDVVSSRQAGFATVGLRRDPTANEELKNPGDKPDFYVDNLTELLEIFPDRKAKEILPAANLSLSTMWAIDKFPRLSDFFEQARRMGFGAIELNHKVNSAMLEGIDLSQFLFSSVHEPCPSDISTEELKARDWLISAPDEENRTQAVEAIKRSIDLAHRINAPVIVLHSGWVPGLVQYEDRMRALVTAGETDTDEFINLSQTLISEREKRIGPHFASVNKSLLELITYARQFQIRIGLENRYHIYDIPIPDEMEELLAMAPPDQLGFIYDVGHAQTLENLDFFPHEEWLHRFSSRMIGTHLHDVKRTADHFAPGLGEVDFRMVQSYLADEAYRAFEVQNWNSFEDLVAGRKLLSDINLIKFLDKQRID